MSDQRRRPPLGQHFLISEAVIHRLVESIGPKPLDTMIEIGSGTGALTRRLAGRVGELHAIEIDERHATALANELGAEHVHVHKADALRFDYASVARDGRKIRLVGNLPYSISTELMALFVQHAEFVQDACFMLQKEVADRLSAECGTKKYGRLTVSVTRRMSVEPLFDVPPDAFSPPPRVQSSVIYMQPKKVDEMPEAAQDRFDQLVRKAFGSRRKTLRNSLSGIVSERVLAESGIDPGLRAENLTARQYEILASGLPATPDD